MKLETQVCSLELAKRLKELGVKQESLFYWSVNRFKESEGRIFSHSGDSVPIDVEYSPYAYAAFTVAELGEMLPWAIKEGTFNSYKDYDNGYQFYLQSIGIRKKGFYSYNEANVRAKMLIWLIENGKVKP